MKFRFLSLLAFLAALLAAPLAAEAKLMFGKDETIHKLQDVDITGQNGEALFLGYKTTTNFFLAGISIQDDGYVFGVRDDSAKYITTTPEELAKFQENGLLPTPLPAYKIGTVDWIIGNSMWVVVLPLLVIVFGFSWWNKRRAKAAAAAAAPPA